MKPLLIATLATATLALASVVQAQDTINLNRPAIGILQPLNGGTGTAPSTVLPATCRVGQIFFDTNAPAGQNIYGCTAPNTWTLQAAGFICSVTGTLTAGDLIFGTAADACALLSGDGIVRLNANAAPDLLAAPAGTIVGTTDTQTLTNKTLTSPLIATIINTGTLTLPTSTDTLVGRATTDTLTNKRITKRVVTAADAASITPNADTSDVVTQTNTQALGTLTINAPTGTPTDGQALLVRVKSTNAHTLSFNAAFRAGTTALPSAHSGASKWDYYAFIYNSADTKWDYTGSAVGF